MTINELCSQFGISRKTYFRWRDRYDPLIPDPYGGPTSRARYGQIHVDALTSIQRLRHHNVSLVAVAAHCAETGQSVEHYVDTREQSLRDFGLGIA